MGFVPYRRGVDFRGFWLERLKSLYRWKSNKMRFRLYIIVGSLLFLSIACALEEPCKARCDGNFPFCDANSGKCVKCLKDSDCSDPKVFFCDSKKGHKCIRKPPPKPKAGAVDILFVIEDSQVDFHDRLSSAVEALIKQLLIEKDTQVPDVQFAVITTDVFGEREGGKFQSRGKEPVILHSLNKSFSIERFTQILSSRVKYLSFGGSFEQGLEATRLALSEPLVSTHNKGFLRPNTLLTVVFVAEEDDCSHDGSIPEDEMDGDVCRVPKGMKDDLGSPGQMHKLLPTSRYVEFLKSLHRRIVIAGIIGEPEAFDKNNKPAPSFKSCKDGGVCEQMRKGYKCEYFPDGRPRCGGCRRNHIGAYGGYRYHEMLKAFGQGQHWFSVCGTGEEYNQALAQIGKWIHEALQRP